MQAFRLCVVGIPLGLLAGYLAGRLMVPSLTADMEISAVEIDTTETVVALNPFIFIFSAVMALFTVYLSSLKACHIVDKVSPVEALKVEEMTNSPFSRANRKSKSAGWYSMALRNMKHNLQKGIIVMLSIALSLVTINIIYMLVTGYHFEEYQKIFISSDFQIDKMTGDYHTTKFNGVKKKARKLMEGCDAAASTGYVYYSDEKHQMEPRLKKVMNEYADNYTGYWDDNEKKLWQDVKAKNEMTVHYLGISEEVFKLLQWRNKPCSWNDFKSGEYIIVDYPDSYNKESKLSYYHQGDKFNMEYKNGVKTEYEVLGEAIMPYAIDYPYADMFYITVLVPEKEYIRATGNDCAMYGIMDAQKGKLKEVKEYIKENISAKDEMFNVSSVLNMQESFKKHLSKYYTIGAFLVFILVFIGIMNFYNTVATNIISRKREFILLEIVGMTRTQVIKMLVTEGMMYIIGAFILAIVIIYFGAEKLIAHTLGMAFFYHAQTTILPCILMMPPLILIAIIIPHRPYKKLGTDLSLVSQIDN